MLLDSNSGLKSGFPGIQFLCDRGMDGPTDRRMDAAMDRLTDRQTEGWMDIEIQE